MSLPFASAASVSPRRGSSLAAALLLVVAIAAVYRNSLESPFVFDDVAAIVENTTLRDFRAALAPPADRGLPVSGRPVVNLSLAMNYAAGGLDPRGYHLASVGLHALAALAVFGVVRRTLLQRALRETFGAAAAWIAAIAALGWAVHPLQTAAVSYVSQRAEVLVGLFYLFTLYAFIRSLECHPLDDTRPRRGWAGAAVVACAAGMASKEVMVSAPLMVLLYDRTFVAGSFGRAWRARWRTHLALMMTWGLLAWLMLGTGGRAGTAGFNLGITPWAYALKQCDAVVHYLRLAFWPEPLVFDYGGAVLVESVREVTVQAGVLALLVAGTSIALWRRSLLGFWGAWVFGILAPTSSIVPVADTMFEHRMYLPLAAVVTAVAVASWSAAGRWGLAACALGAAAFGVATVDRNEVYHSELALWQDTVAKRPESVRAHYTLGSVLVERGKLPEAIAHYEIALRLNPRSAQAHNNLGNVLVRLGRLSEAVSHYEAALAITPTADAHSNLGGVLVRMDRRQDARRHFEAALRLRPDAADAHNNLANLLAQAGEFAAAEQHYSAAVRARPDHADAHANLANVLAQTGRLEQALQHYEAALRLRPDFADARFNLARVLVHLRRWSDAIAQYEAVLRLQPAYRGARDGLAHAEAMRAALGN